MMLDHVYPLTVVRDRYAGIYSGAKYTAWNLECSEVPMEIRADDCTCAWFWSGNRTLVGFGDTPNDAEFDLYSKMLLSSDWMLNKRVEVK